mgnify:FL=1
MKILAFKIVHQDFLQQVNNAQLVTLTVKNVLDQYRHVHLVKEVCIFTILNVLMFAHNQLYRVQMFVLIVMQHVLNALQPLINVLFALKDFIFMKVNVKNVLMAGKEMIKAEIVRKLMKLLLKL